MKPETDDSLHKGSEINLHNHLFLKNFFCDYTRLADLAYFSCRTITCRNTSENSVLSKQGVMDTCEEFFSSFDTFFQLF